jgi:hypothetical protein
MNPRWLWVAAVCVAACAAPAQADFHDFRIDQVFSNADGSVQYIVMRESMGNNSEHLWSGQVLRTTNVAGASKQFAFAANLPSASTASRSVLIATADFAALGLVTPDYTIPARFIPTDGGTLNFAGVDQITLPALPGDGATAITRNGTTVPGTPRNFANATGTMTPLAVTSIEFYNQALDHYFISALAPDIDALDTGRLAGWQRTGLSFRVFPSQAAGGAGVTPVCRIIIPPPHGDSHFFGRSADECGQTLAKFPFMSQETAAAFFVTLPVVGACPAGTIPVYRVFSNRTDANHRYTTDRAVRTQMAGMGWIVEGDGADFVVMCAPPGGSPAAGPPVETPPPPPPPPSPPPPPPPCVPDYYGYCPPG